MHAPLGRRISARFQCEFCEWSFGMKTHLFHHLEIAHGFTVKTEPTLNLTELSAVKSETPAHANISYPEASPMAMIGVRRSNPREEAFTCKCTPKQQPNVHSGAGPFECSQCDKTFTANVILKAHLRTHSNERPFQCIQCGNNSFQFCFLSAKFRHRNILRRVQLAGGWRIINMWNITFTSVITSGSGGWDGARLKTHPSYDSHPKEGWELCNRQHLNSKTSCVQILCIRVIERSKYFLSNRSQLKWMFCSFPICLTVMSPKK